MVNQIECHTKQQQEGLVAYCHGRGIRCTAYSPISGSDLEHLTVQKLAAAHGVLPGDVVLRWLRQRGIVAIPKSVTPSRILGNLTGGEGWALSAAEMVEMAAMQEPGRKTAADKIV
jgi:diketogulonate reductase-like aldo/keto reductase